MLTLSCGELESPAALGCGLYLGQASALAQRCDMPKLCKKWHAAVSASAYTLPPTFSVHVWSVAHQNGKSHSRYSSLCPSSLIYCPSNVLSWPIESSDEAEESPESSHHFFFICMTTEQYFTGWQIPYSLLSLSNKLEAKCHGVTWHNWNGHYQNNTESIML